MALVGSAHTMLSSLELKTVFTLTLHLAPETVHMYCKTAVARQAEMLHCFDTIHTFFEKNHSLMNVFK